MFRSQLHLSTEIWVLSLYIIIDRLLDSYSLLELEYDIYAWIVFGFIEIWVGPMSTILILITIGSYLLNAVKQSDYFYSA